MRYDQRMRRIVLGVGALVAVGLALYLLWPSGPGARRAALAGEDAQAAVDDPHTGGDAPPLAAAAPGGATDTSANAGSLEVRVTAKAAPIVGAKVKIWRSGVEDPNTAMVSWLPGAEGVTGPGGRVQLPARPGTYYVAVRADGYAPERRIVNRAAGEPLTRVTIAVQAAVSLRGVTVDGRTGEAVPLTELAVSPSLATNSVRGSVPGDDLLVASSDARGQFSFDGLAPGSYLLQAHAPGYAKAGPIAVTLPAREPLRLALSAAATIEGFVVDGAGQPAAGAVVTGVGKGIDLPPTATTGDGGGFSLEVSPGTIELSARRGAEAGSLLRPIVVAPGATVRGISLRLGPGAAISGKVTSTPGGDPLRGAVVSVSPYLRNGDSGRALTAADGTYAVEGLAAGGYDVVVSAEGHSEQLRRGVTLAAGQRFTVDVEIGESPALEGRITRADGSPVEGARVSSDTSFQLLSRGTVEAVSDADGRYTLSPLTAGQNVIVARRGGEGGGPSLTQIQNLQAGETGHLDFTFADTGTLTGRVIASGGAVPDAFTVIAMGMRGRGSAFIQLRTTVPPGSAYTLQLPGGVYRVRAIPGAEPEEGSAPFGGGARLRSALTVTVKEGETTTQDLTVRDDEDGPEATISGTVTEADGSPSVGAQVTASARVIDGPATTDAQGRFTLSFGPSTSVHAADLQITLRAVNGGRRGSRAGVSMGDAQVVIPLAGAAVLRGRVVSRSGKPVPGFSLTVSAGRESREQRHFQGDRFELGEVAIGNIVLEATTTDGRRGEREVSVAAGENEVEVTVLNLGRLHGRVLDAVTRQPVPEVAVVMMNRGGGRPPRSDAKGEFQTGELSAGPHDLTFFGEAYQPLQQRVEIPEGENVSLGDVLLTPRE